LQIITNKVLRISWNRCYRRKSRTNSIENNIIWRTCKVTKSFLMFLNV